MKKKIIYIGSAVVILAVGFFIFRSFRSAEKSYSFETAKIEKGTISNTITATGTLEAITTVEVGTQVSGVIEKIYVDYNSVVKKGQLLAQLDETPLLATLEQSKASVDQAEAQVKYQKATYDRYKALLEKKLIAQADFDQAEYNYKNAVATLNNAKSVHEKNRINLSYARIYSPIDGIILDRAVDEGQTVAASFNTPTLFTIANDLTQMRVEANVDEADIGQVRNGQRVEFTVDAFPGRKFNGEVTEIRLQPVESSNVITYTVVINAPNPDKILMPGMTANATFFVTEKKDILLVPAKALRFSPDPDELAGYFESISASQQGPAPEGMAPQGALMAANATKPETTSASEKSVWVKQGPMIRLQKIEVGETDEAHYEVISGLNEGDEVVLSMSSGSSGSQSKTTAARSPFMPQRPGSNRKTNNNAQPPQP
jgi:HlyD family secretion protein